MIFKNDLLFLLPELYLGISLLFVLVYSSTVQKNYNLTLALNYTYKITPVLSLLIFLTLLGQNKSDILYFNFLLENNHLTNTLKILISGFFLMLSFVFIQYYNNESSQLGDTYEHSVLMLLSILGMFFLCSANDFFILFLGIELMSLASYVLAASKKNVVSSLEAGLKYFVLGAFSSGILLLGISLIYGSVGITNLWDIKYFFIQSSTLEQGVWYVFLVGFSFITVGLFFKLAVAPFHSWAPDVYSGSPTFITAFFSMLPKIAIVGVLVKLFFSILFEINFIWSFFLIFCSATSLILGCLGAIYNIDLKRLMAYGTVNHLGFIFLSLSSTSVEGVQAGFFYLIIYLILNLNFFSILLSLRTVQNKKRVLRTIQDLSFIISNHSVICIFLILNFFSMAGIPPLAGFFSKFYVLYSALNNAMLSLSFLAVIVSAISCFYYIRMIKSSMFESETENDTISMSTIDRIPTETALVIVISALFNLFFFIDPNFLLSTCYNISYKIFM